MCKKVIIEPRYPEVDEEGFTEFQLWQLMNIYGPHLANGCNVAFEDCVIYIRDEDLEEVECQFLKKYYTNWLSLWVMV